MITLFLFALVPLITMLITSFQSDAGGGFTLENYKEFFSSSIYLRLTGKTIVMSLMVTIVSLVIAYPRLYHGKKLKGLRNVILILVIIPFFYKSAGACVQLAHFSSGRGILNNFLNIFGLL